MGWLSGGGVMDIEIRKIQHGQMESIWRLFMY